MRLESLYNKVLAVYVLLFFFLGVANYKLDNTPTDRPFFYIHIALCLLNLAVFITAIFLNRNLLFNKERILIALLSVGFLGGLFSRAVNGSYERELIYVGIHYLGTCSLFLLMKEGLCNKNFVAKLTEILIFLAVVASFSAFFLLLNFGEQFRVFGLLMTQNAWTFPRVHGFMGDPTSLGGLLGMTLILTILHYEGGFKRALIFLMILALLATGSRNAVLSLALSFGVVKVYGMRVSGKNVVYGFFSVVLALLIFVILPMIFPDLLTFFDRGIDQNNANSRPLIWSETIRRISEFGLPEVFFGSGFGSLKLGFRSAFNIFLELFHDVGAMGVLTYLIIMLCLFWVCVQSKQEFALVLFFYLLFFNQFIFWILRDTFNFVTVGYCLLFTLSARIIERDEKFDDRSRVISRD